MFPINTSKEHMLFDFLNAMSTYPVFRITAKSKILQKYLGTYKFKSMIH